MTLAPVARTAAAFRSPSSLAGSGCSRLWTPVLPQQISASTSSRSSMPGMLRSSRRGWSADALRVR